MSNAAADLSPFFLGQAPFGDPKQFTAAVFTGPAAAEDTFLGVAPGTTRYNPCAAGGAIACTGVLVGPTSAAVATAQAALAALAGECGTLIVPTGMATFGGFDTWSGCRFAPGDLAFSPGGIVAAPSGGGYQLPYRVVFRRAGPPITSGFMSDPPLPPNFPSSFSPEGLPV
jgi:hypothetical protein